MSGEKMSGDQIRRALASGLAGVARGLSAFASMVEQASWILRPREPAAERLPAPDDVAEPGVVESGAAEPAGPEPVTPTPGEPEPVAAESGEREPVAAEPERASGAPDHSGVAETHIAELGDRPVAAILDELPKLSTDELEQLYAYEVTHKNRKTVRRAIERAVQPASSSP